jgi:hypothetical protein
MATLVLIAPEFRSRGDNEATMPAHVDAAVPDGPITIAERFAAIQICRLFEPGVASAVL